MSPSEKSRLSARERPSGLAVMRQRWAGLLFLHWRINPALIQKRLPPGLFVDTFDGSAWIGVVPFFMERVRPTFLFAVPWLSNFYELNVRTYVHDTQGNPGVWFFSLDCDQPIAVEIARRVFHLPYQHASMWSEKSGESIHFSSQRKYSNTKVATFTYETPHVTNIAEFGTLEWFLVERYLLFSTSPKGGLWCGKVHHVPYEIEQGKCSQWSSVPLELEGLLKPEESPHSVLTAKSVDVEIFPLRRCHS